MSELTAHIGSMNKDNALPDSDLLLMSRLHDGDAKAMDELIQAHGTQLSRLVGRLTAWSSEQDDILQEVLLAVWQRAGAYRGEGSLEGWLRRIAVNTCRNQQRADRALIRTLKRFAFGGNAMPESVPPASDQDEQAEEIRAALASLHTTDRTILVLYYLEALETRQIAETLNVSPQTLHVKLHRARNRLENILNERNDAVPVSKSTN